MVENTGLRSERPEDQSQVYHLQLCKLGQITKHPRALVFRSVKWGKEEYSPHGVVVRMK